MVIRAVVPASAEPVTRVIVAAGDELASVALLDLMERHERSLYNLLVVLLHDRDQALDCTQETFLRAYEHLGRGRPVNPGWLFRVARDLAMDEYRRRRRFEPANDTLENLAAPSDGRETIALREALAQLPSLDRAVLHLSIVVGLHTDEIGSLLGVRGTAVRQRLYRARAHLRLLYEPS